MSNQMLDHTIGYFERSIAADRLIFERDLAYAAEALTQISRAKHQNTVSGDLSQVIQRVTALVAQASKLEADTTALSLMNDIAGQARITGDSA